MPGDEEIKRDENEAEPIGIDRARAILGELLNRAGYGNERIPITRSGKQVAYLVGVRDVERLRQLDGAAA